MDTMSIELLRYFGLIGQKEGKMSSLSVHFKNIAQRRICIRYYKRIIEAYYWLYRWVVSQELHQQIFPSLLTTNFKHRKVKHSGLSALYYPNSCVVHQVLLQGGRYSFKSWPSEIKCDQCQKIVTRNQKNVICVTCFGQTHLKCMTVNQKMQSISNWTCSKCLLTELPFYTVQDLELGILDNQLRNAPIVLLWLQILPICLLCTLIFSVWLRHLMNFCCY